MRAAGNSLARGGHLE